MNNKFLFSVLALLFCLCSFGQLVNIESLRMQTDEDRFVLQYNLDFFFNNSDNASSIFSIGNSLGTQIKSKDLRKIYFLNGNFRLTRIEGEDLRNNWFLHMRFNYKLEKWAPNNALRFETFIQSQYDEILDVNHRNLVGLGFRYKLISNENRKQFKKNQATNTWSMKKRSLMRFYLGYAYMYEEEKSDSFNIDFFNHRSSAYGSFNFESANGLVAIINTIYYQPLYKNFSNYNLTDDLLVMINLSEKLRINFNFNYSFDSVTPRGRKQYTSDLSVGLGLNL